MDNAKKRWKSVEKRFGATGIPFERFPAVNGRELVLPISDFSESEYRRRHGKHPNLGTIGCYLSHVAVLKKFLASEHSIAIIGEDDIEPVANLKAIIEKAIQYSKAWDILRLSGFHNSHPKTFVSLGEGLGKQYSLAVNFSRLSGTGAYMVTRKAAEVLSSALLPMTVPIDHAIDREWAYGLRGVSIHPLPIEQESLKFVSQLRAEVNEKLPAYKRYWTVFPYRACNEIARLISRSKQLKSARAAIKSLQI